ncbi:MAG: ROK family protein [Bacteroidales bacterium]
MEIKPYVIGIDIGGQSAKIGVCDTRGNIIAHIKIGSRQTELSEFVNDLSGALKKIIAEVGGRDKIRGIGVGAPNGNYYKNSIEYAPNLEWGKDENGTPTVIPLGSILKDLTSLPVAITNDANAAAYGEMTYGCAHGLKDFIMLTLGTGVGSGIVINGEILYGHDGFAGELGHTIAVKNGRKCGCGRYGCLETYASATGVARTAKEFLLRDDKPSLLRDYDIEKITSKDIYDCAKKDDKLAIEIFEFTGKIIGERLADFVAFSAPEAIILFGGLAAAKEFIEKPIYKTMNENLLVFWKDKIKLLFSTLPNADAAILGASSLAWEL